ncbi:MFS general substrate transporter [Suillus fuscotomentosus]|uniref:MFS general substrate transporter n=1 Tax=Suillus fuscotomentosus TaxID=1912939 RepID=A0AAD4HJ92_9AGAM|nr:MFS general substrate transporter [Suillus fuscotomentosus]KAG1899670.1 MFS general substrate transporter [Suillus fuscotomentosus]
MEDVEKQADSSSTRGPSIETSAYENLNRHSALQPTDALLLPTNMTNRDRGWAGWLAVFGAFLALFCSFGQMNAFGTYQSWYSHHQLSSHSQFSISWIGSLQLWTFFFMGGPIGRLFDAYGPSPVMLFGTVLLTFSMLMTSISTKYYEFLLFQGFFFGLSVGSLFYPSLAAVSTHFDEYRASALGVVAAGSGVGGVVYPIMLRQLFLRTGYAWAVRASTLLSVACCIVALVTVKRVEGPKKCSGWMDVKMLKDACFMLLATGSFFICLGIFTPFFYIVNYAEDRALVSQNIGFYVLSVMNAGGVFGRIVPAILSDKMGRYNLLMPTSFLAGLSCLVFWMLAKTMIAVMGFAAVYGFLSGAFISVITPCVAQISDINEIGSRIGALYTLISIPSLIGGPIAGALIQCQGGSYTGVIGLSGTSIIIGSLFILACRLRINRNIWARV